ncbi:hypothetical protein [Allohahella sp. A8]|uniref:hypothetical protein n=1 Tax=Allohahella sp. A8 TaxID=3141461 RepID=UPI003A7FAF84
MNDSADESRDRRNTVMVVVKALGAIGVIAAALFTYMGQLDTNEVKRLDSQNVHIKQLQSDVKILRELVESANQELTSIREHSVQKDLKIAQLTMQVEALKAIISREVNLHDWLQDDIDANPFPIVIKRIDHESRAVKFPTYLVNNAFSQRFGVSKRRYEGKTSAEIFSPRSHAVFYAGNKHVYENRTWRLQDECYDDPSSGQEVCSPVLRYYTTLPDGSPAIKVIIFIGMDIEK